MKNAGAAAAGNHRAEGAAGRHRPAASIAIAADPVRIRRSIAEAEDADCVDEHQACGHWKRRSVIVSSSAPVAKRSLKAAQAAQARLNDVLLPAGRRMAQADITMVSMTIGGDANQVDDDAAQAGLDPGAGIAQGFADLGRLRQSSLQA